MMQVPSLSGIPAGQTLDKIDPNVESITAEPTRKNTADSAVVGNNGGNDEPFLAALKSCNERIDELDQQQKQAENI